MIDGDVISVVVLRSGTRKVAAAVEEFVHERDAFLKKLDPPASHLRHLAGAILLEDGSVALVLNSADLVEGMKLNESGTMLRPRDVAVAKKAASVLVVDDSFTTRTLETSILETHGYDVEVAVDGVEALEKLRSRRVDLVVSDVEMPRLDGFGLLEAIKADDSLSSIPTIIVTSLNREEDRRRGLDLGADAYIVKQRFDHQELLSTIRQILGEGAA